GGGHRLRPRPRQGVRPGRGAARPHGHPRVDHRPDGAERRSRPDPDGPWRGHRGDVDDEAGGAMTTRVLIVDDHRLFRAGVRAELGPEVEVVGEAGDVDSAVRAIEELKPDVVLLDVHMPGGGGQEVLRRVLGKGSPVRFLALSVSDAAEDVIGVIRAGARGYVTKTIGGKELTDA